MQRKLITRVRRNGYLKDTPWKGVSSVNKAKMGNDGDVKIELSVGAYVGVSAEVNLSEAGRKTESTVGGALMDIARYFGMPEMP